MLKIFRKFIDCLGVLDSFTMHIPVYILEIVSKYPMTYYMLNEGVTGVEISTLISSNQLNVKGEK